MLVKRAVLLAAIGLSGCGGNPFTGDPDNSTTDEAEAIYGSTIDPELVMNSMTYDPAADQLVVNNIPFDGATAPNGEAIYARQGNLGASGFGRYENVAGELEYYAVFRRSDSGSVEAGAFGTASYVNPGPGGAGVRRTGGLSLPASGEYTFTGQYAAVRSFETSSTAPANVQYITGTSEILLDFGDYDDKGAVVGRITNRSLYATDGSLIGSLDDYISLAGGDIDRTTGKITGGGATGRDGSTQLSEGSWTAVLGGSNATEIAGIIVLTGSPDDSSSDVMRETGVLIATRP